MYIIRLLNTSSTTFTDNQRPQASIYPFLTRHVRFSPESAIPTSGGRSNCLWHQTHPSSVNTISSITPPVVTFNDKQEQ